MTEIVNVSPTLIIGLGGTGSYALQYVKRKIRRRLEKYNRTSRPLPKHIPFIEYLVIDTTAQEEVLEEFVPDEFKDIGGLNISRIIAELEQGSDNQIQSWFPKNLDPGQIDSGAGGVRHIGRLCFFINHPIIEDAIRGKVKNIKDSANVRNFISEHLPGLRYKERSTIDVHIVSSLCGGTGSACLLDTAYLVKHVVADDQKQQTNSSAHLITTEPFEIEPGVGRTTREYIQTNFAVTLSELEHFTQKDAPQPWEVVYRNGTRVSSREKPFSTAYLLGCKEGASLSKEHVCEIIGEGIAIKTVHPEGRRIKGIIENYKPHVINTEDLKQKRRTYSSYNARILDLGVDASLFESAAMTAARAILTSLCPADGSPAALREDSPEAEKAALEGYEEGVFADKAKLSSISFGEFRDKLRAEVEVTQDMYGGVSRNLRSIPSMKPKKRKKEAPPLASNVLVACEGPDEVVRNAQEQFLFLWGQRFRALREATDNWINELLSEHSLGYVQTLLKNVSERLLDFLGGLNDYRKTLQKDGVGRGLYDEIVKACEVGSINGVPALCADRAAADAHGAVLKRVDDDLSAFRLEVEKRARWCGAARQCLEEAKAKLPDNRRLVAQSHTTSSVWTQDALEGLIAANGGRFVRGFINLLEREYRSDGAPGPKVSFLLRLNDSLNSIEAAKRLAQEAAREGLRAEVAAAADNKRREAERSMHEFVELASPPWQIERLGEEVAAVSLTTCPVDSEAGQIMARSGKNINFSRNGGGGDEYMLFCSEHGVSVSHLINFRRCLKAVYRKLRSEGKGRINDLCLDPKGWNIASPLPIEEEMERLRLYFSLAIHLGVLKQQMDAYTFSMPSGAAVELRRDSDVTEGVKRYEAFESLLDLDCDGSEASSYFKRVIEGEIARLKRNEHVHDFRALLVAYADDLRRAIPRAKAAPDRVQMEKEVEGIRRLVAEIDEFLEGLERDGDAG